MQDFNGSLRFEMDMLAQIDIGETSPAKQLSQAIVAKLLSDQIDHATLPSDAVNAIFTVWPKGRLLLFRKPADSNS
jgi:hypothetical protein